jgi:hypothetical protein
MKKSLIVKRLLLDAFKNAKFLPQLMQRSMRWDARVLARERVSVCGLLKLNS